MAPVLRGIVENYDAKIYRMILISVFGLESVGHYIESRLLQPFVIAVL
jgi:hypothetical protein